MPLTRHRGTAVADLENGTAPGVFIMFRFLNYALVVLVIPV